jgi:hypothetical protein
MYRHCTLGVSGSGNVNMMSLMRFLIASSVNGIMGFGDPVEANYPLVFRSDL